MQPYPYLLAILWSIEEGKLPPVSGLSFEKTLARMIKDENIFMRGVAYKFKALSQRKDGLPPQKILQTLNTSIKWLGESGHQIQLASSLIESVRLNLSLDSAKVAEKNGQKGVPNPLRVQQRIVPLRPPGP